MYMPRSRVQLCSGSLLTHAALMQSFADVQFFVCRLQRELKKNIKRARTMNLIPYKSKLPQFQKSENPFLDS